jgi:hypothetical protein
MTDKICYWDDELKAQFERDADSDEQAELDARRAAARDIEPKRTQKNAQINQWRLEANQSTFQFMGKPIGCDTLSRGDIDGVAGSIALFGDFPSNFPMAWKCADNTYISLPDVASFKAMYSAMTDQGTITFNRSQQLKAALSAASTKEEIDAIVW